VRIEKGKFEKRVTWTGNQTASDGLLIVVSKWSQAVTILNARRNGNGMMG
jgi:hypothetical protein